MKRLSKLMAITLLIVPTALSAQQRPEHGRGPGAGSGAFGAMDPAARMERLVRFLDLSDAQRVQIEEVMAAQGESRKALSETMRSQNGAMQKMLESERPDPTAIGNKALELHGLRKQMAADQEAHMDAVRTLLTPDQIERFDALMAARDFTRDRDGNGPGRKRPDRG